MRQLKFKKELKNFPSRNNCGQKNRFAPELNEKEVIELLENTRERKESHKLWHENISR